MSDKPNDDDTWNLVMPFVACATNGGVYDDDAFVAGYTCGTYAAEFTAAGLDDSVSARHVHPGIVAQLDLLAMQSGWLMAATPMEDAPDEWVWVEFTRPDPQESKP